MAGYQNLFAIMAALWTDVSGTWPYHHLTLAKDSSSTQKIAETLKLIFR